MKFKIAHTNFNVLDLDKSIAYKALVWKRLEEMKKRMEALPWCLWGMGPQSISRAYIPQGQKGTL